VLARSCTGGARRSAAPRACGCIGVARADGGAGVVGLASFPIGLRIPGRMGAEGLEAVAAWAKAAGLDALDLHEATPERIEILQRHGLALGSVDAVGIGDILSRDPGRRQRGTEALLRQIEEVARLGGKVLFACLIPGERGIGRAEGFALWAEHFPPIVEAAERHGLAFALEGWPGGAPDYPCIGSTPEVLRAMFARVPSPALGLCYDPSHLVRLGIDYIRFLDEFGGRVRHCHGKDTEVLPEGRYLYGTLPAVFDKVPGFSEGSWRYCVPGDGEVDWARVGFRLERWGYRGVVSIELEDARYSGSAEAERRGVQKALAHLRTHLN
jgi:sugar phosphate isomerase/epimerase